jgi:hypothetical protein
LPPGEYGVVGCCVKADDDFHTRFLRFDASGATTRH